MCTWNSNSLDRYSLTCCDQKSKIKELSRLQSSWRCWLSLKLSAFIALGPSDGQRGRQTTNTHARAVKAAHLQVKSLCRLWSVCVRKRESIEVGLPWRFFSSHVHVTVRATGWPVWHLPTESPFRLGKVAEWARGGRNVSRRRLLTSHNPSPSLTTHTTTTSPHCSTPTASSVSVRLLWTH